MQNLEPFTGRLESDGDYDGFSFDGLDLSGQEAEFARIIECAFTRCTLDDVTLEHVQLLDTTLTEVHAGTLGLADATWRDVTLTDCRLGAVHAYGGGLTRVTIRGGKIDYLNLRDAHLTDVRLEGCVIGDLDLLGARATRLEIVDCRVRRLDLTHATLTEVDLRGADLSGLDGPAGLAGATISEQQLIDLAALLAAHLGITVA